MSDREREREGVWVQCPQGSVQWVAASLSKTEDFALTFHWCVWVCVCLRAREREREKVSLSLLSWKRVVRI